MTFRRIIRGYIRYFHHAATGLEFLRDILLPHIHWTPTARPVVIAAACFALGSCWPFLVPSPRQRLRRNIRKWPGRYKAVFPGIFLAASVAMVCRQPNYCGSWVLLLGFALEFVMSWSIGMNTMPVQIRTNPVIISLDISGPTRPASDINPAIRDDETDRMYSKRRCRRRHRLAVTQIDNRGQLRKGLFSQITSDKRRTSPER